MNLSNLSLDFTSIRRAYASGELNPVELVDEIYRRIELDDDPHIWLHLIPRESALEQAERTRKAGSRGDGLPLYGLPYGVKDNIDVAGVPTTAGSSAFSYVPAQSAAVVERLNAAGAILIGKQNMDQFATGLVGTRSLNGHCRNALSRAHIPGGSSSGSAVAVAKGHVAFSIGSDTGGSGRVPAACNNVVGLKPTPGLISTSGFVYCNRTFDVAPVFALTVDDAYDVFDFLIGPDERDPFSVHVTLPDESVSASKPFSFGVIREDQLDFFGDEQARHQYEAAIVQLVELGGQPVPIDFSPFLEAGDLVFNSGLLAERAIAYGEIVNSHPDTIHPVVLSALRSAQR